MVSVILLTTHCVDFGQETVHLVRLWTQNGIFSTTLDTKRYI